MVAEALWTLILLSCGCVVPTECLMCSDCKDIVDPTLCTTTKTCGQDESCFMEKTTTGSSALFTLGCMPNQQCAHNSTTIIGRSLTVRQNQRCHECCSTDNCAAQLCSHQTPPAVTPRSCYVCSGPAFLCEQLYTLHQCPTDKQYCINTIGNHQDGSRTMQRKCGTKDECRTGWFEKYSSDDKCVTFKQDYIYANNFHCEFCCNSNI